MKTTSSNRQFYALQHVPAKKMRKNFTVSANIPIFAASKIPSAVQDAAGSLIHETRQFLYLHHIDSISNSDYAQCRVAVTPRRYSHLETLTALCAFLCQKPSVMKTNQTALSRPSGIGKNWRAAIRLLLASQVRIDDEVYTVRQFISGILAFFLLFAAIVTAETCLALSFFFLAAAFPVARPIMYHEQQKGGSHEH